MASFAPPERSNTHINDSNSIRSIITFPASPLSKCSETEVAVVQREIINFAAPLSIKYLARSSSAEPEPEPEPESEPEPEPEPFF